MGDPRYRIILLVGLLLIPLTIQGPVQSTAASEGSGVDVSIPRVGSTYTYENPDTGTLTVTIEGLRERADGLQRNHTAVDLNLTWHPRDSNHTYHVVSSVDTAQGLIVNEFTRCAHISPQSDTKCGDERGLLLFASGGLPGAFLAGPLWGTEITPGEEVSVEAHTFTSTQTTLTYSTEPAGDEGLGCLNLTATEVSPHFRPIEGLTPIGGPVKLCGGLALPAAFKTVYGHTWTLTNSTPGGQEIPLAEGPGAWDAQGDPLPMQTWEPPFATASPGHEMGLSVPKAHALAMNRSDAYRDIFRNGTDPLIVSAPYHRDPSGFRIEAPGDGPEAYRSESRVRELVGADAEGRYIVVEVREQIRKGGGFELQPWTTGTPVGPEQRFTVEVVDEGRASNLPTVDTFEQAQASHAAAVQRGRALTQQPVDDRVPHGKMVTLPGHPWDPTTRTVREHGYTIVSYHEDPSQVAPFIIAPYQAIFDGATGATLWVSANNTTLRP